MEYRRKIPCQPAAKPLSPACPKNLDQTVNRFVIELKNRFQDHIAVDPRGFQKQVVQLIRQGLPPRPGRPNDPRLDAAALMVQQGKSVKELLRAQFRDFDRMDPYGRYLAEKGLRAALARRHADRSDVITRLRNRPYNPLH